MRVTLRFATVVLVAALTSGCLGEVTTPQAPSPAAHPDQALFTGASRTAWVYVDQQYQPATGLVNSVAGYSYATVWDMASALAALFCAERLGLLDRQEYDRRMSRALATLQTLRLFDGVTFNKNYSTKTGHPAGVDDRDVGVTERGYGWSAVDLGRLLIWLRIISTHQPRYADEVRRIVGRTEFASVLADGYLRGGQLDASGRVRAYSEGRLGYEQYAAAGYALWNQPVGPALSLTQNTLPITVMDVPLLADRRGHDFLTSEPFVLLGLEVGWSGEMEDFSRRVLRVQEERYHRTGQVTIVSEDALPVPPQYFFYYAINHHGKQFVVGAQDSDATLDGPRWVSAKAAFGWHALRPSEYTRKAVEYVAGAADARGWGTGAYERTGAPTAGHNLNTAAVILESALYARTGRPLVQR